MSVGRMVDPPVGAWRHDDGLTREVGASTRCASRAVLMSFLTLLSLVLAVGMAAGMGGDILRGLGLGPAGGKVVGLGEALAMMGAGLLAWGVAVGMGMYTGALWMGTTVVRLRGGLVEVSTGLGPLRVRRRFSAAEAVGVSEVVRVVTGESGSSTLGEVLIERRSGDDVRLGSMVSPERLAWLARATAELLGVPLGAWEDGGDEDGLDRDDDDQEPPTNVAGGAAAED